MMSTLNEITGSLALQLYLDFYHHSILVSGNEVSLIEKLREEFDFFVRPEVSHLDATVELFQEVSPEIPSLVAVKILENASVYRLGQRQYIDYGDALAIWDQFENTVKIYSQNTERLFELGFLAIHSLLGQGLEKRGLCRVHAMAVSLGNTNAVLMLPSKGGKSTLLGQLLEHPDIKIISDDMPLIDLNGYVHAFPSKISFTARPSEGFMAGLKWSEFVRAHYPPKWTAGLAGLKDKIERESPSHQTLLIAGKRLSQGRSLLSPISKWRMTGPLLEHMIIGLGLPQIIELFLKFKWTDIFKLMGHAFVRTFCAFQVARKSKCFFFYLGPDRNQNAQLILDLLHENQSL